MQDDFFICKAEEGGVAVATATDVGAADEKSDKSIWQLLNIRCTSNKKSCKVISIINPAAFLLCKIFKESLKL